MPPSGGSGQLERLRRDSERALLAFGRRLGVAPPDASDASEAGGGVSPVSQGALRYNLPAGQGIVSDTLNVNVNLAGGTIFLDDERRVRALAKEIKRLISEDKRRGLAV